MSQTTEKVYESTTTIVHRVVRDDRAVVTKRLKDVAVTPNAVARYHHEFSINQSLTSPHVCRALAYDKDRHEIEFDDLGAQSLRELLATVQLEFEEKITIASRLASAVQSIHDEGVVHRDINPANILVSCSEDGEFDVWLIDFGLATLSAHEHAAADAEKSLAGTLAYIAPEQTGRVNRVIDYRTDLYSMGATYYELFSGRPPFEKTDPLELIHAHIASTPKPLKAVQDDVPVWLSELVAKLLAKQPDARYQSAASVVDDLNDGISQGNAITFRLGTTDGPSQLSLPRKLYGREDAVTQFSGLIERCRRGETLYFLLYGGAGMGKSSLIDALARDAHAQGLLIARTPGTPAEDLADICLPTAKSLLRQLLSSTTSEALATAQRVSEMRSTHAAALAEQVGELASVVGLQDPGSGSWLTGFQELLATVSPMPVCWVIENAHLVSEDVMTAVAEVSIQVPNLLVLVSADQAELTALQAPKFATKLIAYPLLALEKGEIRNLLADMLHHSDARVRELASTIYDKTDGLPGHLFDLLFELHHQGILFRDPQSGEWSWNIDAIYGHYFTHSTLERVQRQLAGAAGQNPRGTRRGGMCRQPVRRSDHRVGARVQRHGFYCLVTPGDHRRSGGAARRRRIPLLRTPECVPHFTAPSTRPPKSNTTATSRTVWSAIRNRQTRSCLSASPNI